MFLQGDEERAVIPSSAQLQAQLGTLKQWYADGAP